MNVIVWKIRKFSTPTYVYLKICVILALHTHTLLLTSAETLTDTIIYGPDVRQLKENYILILKRPTHHVYSSNNKFDKIMNLRPNKRAPLLLDRIMVALQKAVDDGSDVHMKGYYPEMGSGLQRRDQDKGKVYWRCYFNAVTCF